MIALVCLIVITKYAYAITNECEPILETMTRAAYRTRDLPDHDFDERAVVRHVPLVEQQLAFMLEKNNNNNGQLLSMTPTQATPANEGSAPTTTVTSKALVSRPFER